jgi:ribosomal protein S14
MTKHSFKKFQINYLVNKELKKNLIKFFLSNNYSNFKSKKIINLIYKNLYFYKYASISFFKRSCLFTGNCKSVFCFFKLSRYVLRTVASKGVLIGLRKASF